MTATYKEYKKQREFLELCLEPLSHPHAKNLHNLFRDDLTAALKSLEAAENDLRQEDPTRFPDPIADDLRKRAAEFLRQAGTDHSA